MPAKQNGWSEWSKVVLTELERLNKHYEEIDEKMDEIRNELTKVKTVWKSIDTLNEWKKSIDEKAIIMTVEELKSWKDKIDEVWSPSQMKENKTEVESHKSKWVMLWTIFIVAQVIIALLSVFKDKIF